MVYDNELVGVKQADADALTQLLEQEPNTRFLGTSVGVMLYRFGNQFYDSSKVASKRKVTSEQLIALQSTKDSVGNELNYKQKEEKLKLRLESLDNKLEFGNTLMRTGNPVVLLDSSLVEKSRKNMKGYLINHGFFDADVNFKVALKNKKAVVSYQIDEKEAYLLDSVFTRTDNPAIQGLI